MLWLLAVIGMDGTTRHAQVSVPGDTKGQADAEFGNPT